MVRLREHSAEKVRALIAEVGCVVTEEVVQHYPWPESTKDSDGRHQEFFRQLEPWNAPEAHVHPESRVSAAVLEKKRAVAALKLHRPDDVAVPAA